MDTPTTTSPQKPLTVYKASAGSGKTFTLAVEYMKLVIDNPDNYRNILAVTFTNKATEEMKLRILSQLYGIAHELSDSRPYLEALKTKLSLTDKQIITNAGLALDRLLHNYSYFRVETIDSFFQSVMRNLARELSLNANLKLSLNDNEVEQLAVDELIESLSPQDSVLSWIIEYANENIDDDKSWNVIGQIKRFGTTIYKDFYKAHSQALNQKLNDKHFFNAFKQSLIKQRDEAARRMADIGERFFKLLGGQSVKEVGLKGGDRGPASYFRKLRDGGFSDPRLKPAATDAGSWLRKEDNQPGTALYELVVNSILPLAAEAEEMRPECIMLFNSADLTLRHLNQLRLLDAINGQVEAINKETNRFMLSNTQTLLHSFIHDTDSPFIFEKIGSQLEHIMIDEFQDTSVIQWNNFKVLLAECMSHMQAENLIVGDVKQSIYRWRDGDWRLLNNIEREFPHPAQQLEVKSLTTNHRSERNIIDFNNAFFTLAAKEEYDSLGGKDNPDAEQVVKAYADVVQSVPEKKPSAGHVHVELLASKGDEYREETMEKLASDILSLKASGIAFGDMAVLVRNNDTIRAIANYFTENDDEIAMVSDEAFQLDASSAVKLIISGLRYLTHPDNQLERAVVAQACPLEAFDKRRGEWLSMPIVDLVESLYTFFQLDKQSQQGAYLCAFFDVLNKYLDDFSPDIDDFLQEWDANLRRTAIHSNDVDGVRLLTIHKSKGLEYDHVFMPFCDWKLEKANTTVWCNPTTPPYNELPLVPVDFSESKMGRSVYGEDYRQEHLQNVVDNLNLLYVAFTRASKNLTVYGHLGDKSTRSTLVEQVVRGLSDVLDDSLLTLSETEEALSFDYGSTYVVKKAAKAKSDNVFLQTEVPLPVTTINSYESNILFLQSNKSREFIEDEEQLSEEEVHRKNYIKLGNILHKLFSTIHTTDDIQGALNQLELDGIIYDKHLNRAQLQDLLRKRLDNRQVKDWFSPRWQLFNECSILQYDKDAGKVTERRPDRVMYDGKEMIVVDFKFGHPRPEYEAQVKAYMQLLSSMGYERVKGYLWFVFSNKIVEVR